MSESLEFIAIIAVLAVVLIWYLQNIHAQTQGTCGLLALRDDPETTIATPHKSAYRVKSQGSRHHHEPRNEPQAADDITQKNAARMRRKFRHQDEVRYRVKDKK